MVGRPEAVTASNRLVRSSMAGIGDTVAFFMKWSRDGPQEGPFFVWYDMDDTDEKSDHFERKSQTSERPCGWKAFQWCLMCPCDEMMHEKLNRWCVHFVFIDSKVTQWLRGVPDLLGEASPPMLRIRAESDFALPGSPRWKHNQPSSQLPALKMRKNPRRGKFRTGTAGYGFVNCELMTEFFGRP